MIRNNKREEEGTMENWNENNNTQNWNENTSTQNYGQPYPDYNQSSYQGAAYTPVEQEEPVKMGEWILLLSLTTFVPCVGWILAIVWAFSKTEKKSKVNFCKAYLIVWLIQLALAMVLFIVYGAIFVAMLE